MNILVVTATYPPSANGVAVSTMRTVTELRRLGHTVAVIGPDHGKKSDTDYMALQTIRNIPFLPRDYPVIVPSLTLYQMHTMQKRSWDIIHVHHPKPLGTLALSIGLSLNAPVVFTYHTQHDLNLETHFGWLSAGIKKWIYHIVVKNLCFRVNGVIATTRWLQVSLQKKFPHQKIYHASTAGLESLFYVKDEKSILRKKHAIPSDSPVFLVVSRLSKEKNIPYILSAFSQWAKRHDKGILVLVGDGLYKEHLMKLVRKNRFKSRMIFIGNILNDQLADWYSMSDIFLYSSTTDTIGINILEAMSARLPVVARNHITSREVIRTGYNGILAGRGIAGYVKAMDAALKERKKLSYGARETAKQYMIKNTTKDLIRIYEDVITRFARYRSSR
jgi:1,2-diacylglycerol 3-alpha-glucosyltransferase